VEHKREQLWSFVKDNYVPTPEKPFLHHPWIEQVAQIEAQFGDVSENVRANRAKKIGQSMYIDDEAEEVSKGTSNCIQ
jgi:hypothetical protein